MHVSDFELIPVAEDGAVERGGDELLLARLAVAHGDEHVHGADLGDVVLGAVQPEVLHVALGDSVLLRRNGGGVVGAELVCTNAAW